MAAMHGNNLAIVKQQNLESIKTILYRYAPVSRAEIAEQLALAPPTITNIVGELIGQGVVRELPPVKNANSHGVGRKPIYIDLVPGSRMALGVSLGRDFTHYCITDLRGGIIAQGTSELASENYDVMLKQLVSLLNSLKRKYPQEWEKLVGVGIAMPGIVDTHRGLLRNMGTERTDWVDKPFAKDVSDSIQLPVRLDNNVRARACVISLFRPSLLGDDSTFAFCHVSWGIACPVVLDSRSFQGADAAAGEIGKMILDPSMMADPCSHFLPSSWMPGSLESLSSMQSVLIYCREALKAGECPVLAKICKNPDELRLEQIMQAQNEGDEGVCKILERAMSFIGIALSNIVDFLNPHLIFLSGPMFRNKQNIDYVERTLRAYAFHASDEKLQLVYVDLGEYGGAVGAAASCINKFFLRNGN